MRPLFRRAAYILPLLVLVLSGVLSFWQPGQASATSTTCSKWHYTDTTYKTVCGPFGTYNWNDDLGYVVDGTPANGCTDQIGVSSGEANGDDSGILSSIKSSSVDQSHLSTRGNSCATKNGAGGTDKDTVASDYAITIDGGPGSSTSFGFSSDASITGYFVDDMLLDITATGTYVYENGKSIDLESTVGGYYYDDSSDTTYEYDFGGDNSVGVVQKCNNTKIKFNNVHGAHDGSPYSNDHDIQTVNTHKLPHSGDDIAVTLQLPVPGGDDGDCTDDLKFTGNVRIYDNNPLQNAALIQTDSDNIYTADDDPNFDDTDSSDHHWTASDISAPNNGTVFIQDCSTAISIDPDAAPVGPLEPNTDAADAQPNAVLYKTHKSSTDNSCVIDGSTAEPILVVLADDYQQNTNDNSNENAIPTNDASTDNVKAPSLDCHVHWYNPLSWFLCPLASGLASVAGGLDNAINKALTFNPNSLDPYEDSFHTIRNVALGLLVLGMLVAVISQALGMELLDAYTVRRVLPRLLIVALGIALAQPLIDFFINLSNGLGNGIRALIYAGAGNSAGNGTVGFGGGAAVTENILAMSAIAALGFVGVLSFAATAALAAAVGYLVLILRQMVIIALFVFAPIAFVCYLLPNTEKVWKMWWDSFSKALMMFPIIAGFIAIGRTFATYTDNNLIAFISYFGPYFALPLTFRFAGGALGALAGAAHNSTGGMRSGLGKFRSRRAQQRFTSGMNNVRSEQGIGALNRFEKGRSFNRGLARVATPTSLIPGRLGANSRAAMSTRTMGSVNQAAKALQEAGLQDDGSLNEFAQNWNRVGARVGELRAKGEHKEADALSSFQQFNGNRDMALGAMKTAASFGKLSDKSLQSMDSMFGGSTADKAAKSAVLGDLAFTSKGAGNYVTYAAGQDKDGKILTYSGTMGTAEHADRQASLDRSLMEAGPQVISSIKPFTDTASNGTKVSVKGAVAQSLARNAVNAPGADGERRLGFEEHARAMENFAMAEMSGAYNDPTMKAELDKAMVAIQSDPQSLQFYEDAKESITRLPQYGDNGPLGPTPPPAAPRPGGGTGSTGGGSGDWREPGGYM